MYFSLNIILVMRSRSVRWQEVWDVRERGEMHVGFWSGTPKERNDLKDTDVDGRILLKWIFKEIWNEGVDWIDLAGGWDKWQTCMNTVMNICVA